MNDLRSRHRTLAPVPPLGPRTGEIVSAPPPKARPVGNPLFQASRDASAKAEASPELEAAADHVDEAEPVDPLSFQVSREFRSMPVTAATPDEQAAAEAAENGGIAPFIAATDNGGVEADRDQLELDKPERAPASRPTKRREVHDEDEAEDDKFPWHYQFDDDEPQELQAKSPLLSRAFRSSVG